jgi:hypothetical protein
MESMIMMGGFTLPQKTIREMIVGSSTSSSRRRACATARAASPTSPR